MELKEWSTKTEIKAITKEILERNTGKDISLTGKLDKVFNQAVKITCRDITCPVSQLSGAIRSAVGKHLLKNKKVKGAFVEIISTLSVKNVSVQKETRRLHAFLIHYFCRIPAWRLIRLNIF